MAILWWFSMAISNVQDAVTRGLAKICVYKRKTTICKAITTEQKLQLVTPTYRAQKRMNTVRRLMFVSQSTSTPTLFNPVDCKTFTAFCHFVPAHPPRYIEKMGKICPGPEYDVQPSCWT